MTNQQDKKLCRECYKDIKEATITYDVMIKGKSEVSFCSVECLVHNKEEVDEMFEYLKL